jgi:hypothetical protein
LGILPGGKLNNRKFFMKLKSITAITLFIFSAIFCNAAIAGVDKLDLCHIPVGDPDAIHNIEVAENAASNHMDRHGDFLSPIEDIRLGGQEGDNFIGPTCNGDGTYRTCYYVSGDSLPADDGANYLVLVDDTEYPIAFSTTDGPFIVLCATDLPTPQSAIDVTVVPLFEDSCPFTVFVLYDAPDCNGL